MNLCGSRLQFSRGPVPDMGQREEPPVCSFCEEPVQGDFYYRIGQENVCTDCLKLHFRREAL